MEESYCVKWEKHHNAIVSVFDHLYKHKVLVDCTLAAENKYIKAHRIVLMACSPYFEELLSQHSDNYPIVWTNMKFSELRALVDFCYRGEVRLPQGELPGFLNAARLLHIKGLCEDSSPPHRKRRVSDLQRGGTSGKRARPDRDRPDRDDDDDGDDDDQEMTSASPDHHRHSDPDQEDTARPSQRFVGTNGDSFVHVQGDANSDRSDLDTDEESSGGEEKEPIVLDELLVKNSGGESHSPYRWTCVRCGEVFQTRSTYQEHKKACVPDTGADHPWRCHKCPNTYKNKKDLVRHLLYCGNETERHICERCGSTYKYERGLKRHKIYCGTDVKPMVCNACGKTYKYKRGLRRHQKQQCGLIEAILNNNRESKIKEDAVVKHIPVKTVTLSKAVSSDIRLQDSADEITETLETSAKDLTPSVCSTCGKVYKYRKSYLNHVVNCVPDEADEEDADDEATVTTADKKMSVKADVHPVPDEQEEPSSASDLNQVMEEEPLANPDEGGEDDESTMDDRAIQDELDELVALKKELESEELKASGGVVKGRTDDEALLRSKEDGSDSPPHAQFLIADKSVEST